jgi:hypothetical protein
MEWIARIGSYNPESHLGIPYSHVSAKDFITIWKWSIFNLPVKIMMVVKEEGTNKQAVANELAVYSVRALARLGGYLPAPDLTPDNPIVKVHHPFFPLFLKVCCGFGSFLVSGTLTESLLRIFLAGFESALIVISTKHILKLGFFPDSIG